MSKRKRYEHLCRTQQWRRWQEIPNIDEIEVSDKIEEKAAENNNIPQVHDDNTDTNDININITAEDCEEVNNDCHSNSEESLVESEWSDNDNGQWDQALNVNPRKEIPLRQFLRTWALENNITHSAVTKLLKGLRCNGHENLPSDARTLLQTPTVKSTTVTDSGSFYYYGLRKALEDHLKRTRPVSKPIKNPILINLGIDGLPLTKSSKSQLWPLVGQIIHDDHREEPFFIGAFHGYMKPLKPDEIIDKFIAEYNEIKNERFIYLGRKYSVLVNCVICDAPAKAFVKCIKSHTGFYGCDKCEDEGEWREHRMIFLNESAPLRSDETFLLRTNEEHHLNDSPFETAAFKMVTQFPLDYMHLICLGVMKRLLKFWIKGIKGIKLRSSEINRLSAHLKSLIPHIPREFARKPRGIDELDRWKATEFRLFLLYTSLAIVWSYLPEDYCRHFYVLHCAIFILCNVTDCKYNNEYSKELLVHFVQVFKILYGEEYVTYNVHNLIHLPEDVKIHGCLDMFSGFPFENYLQHLKRILRKSAQPLEQLQRRLIEKSLSTTSIRCDHQQYPILKKPKDEELLFGCTNSHKEVQFDKFTLSCIKQADSFCYTKNKRIVIIEHIGKKDRESIVIGRVLHNTISLPLYPCDSRHLGIHIGDEWSELEVYPVSTISAKAMRLPYKNTYCFIPILHTYD